MESIAIIGAGASGSLLASTLAKENKYKIYLFEKSEHVAKKILVTGNGKCNLTNTYLSSSFYNTPKIENLLKEYDSNSVREWFKERHVKTIEDEEGRVYPFSRSASSIANALYLESSENVSVFTSACVTNISKLDHKFLLHYNYQEIAVDKVVICTGGLANGGTDFFKCVSSFGVKITPLRPALSPIETKEKTISLSGLRVKAKVSVNDFEEEGEVLFKDNGLSGIVIMNASRVANIGDTIHLNLAMGEIFRSIEDIYANFPKMIAQEILKRSNNDLQKALDIIENFTFTVANYYPYKFSHIMKGGISLDEVDLETFMLKKVPNVYVLGEALDVDGACGGYNLHFAFASAMKCAKGLLK